MIVPDTLLQNRYLVVEQIGQGGMGAVYRAVDQRFGSTVALKETFFTDPNLRKAFEREAQLLNRLRHPALPRVSDHFNEEEGQFLVMEFISGRDLSEMLKERAGAPFPTRDVLNWADQLLDALDYLHTQEPVVVHRDIKPQNLKLATRNQIILLDFGLAKGTPSQTRVTATGSLFGYSFNYAPLEQMQGTGTDPRSDLYSLSATLHHLLTAQTPADALSRATAVLNGQPDPLRPAHEINAQVPAAISELLSRAMSLNAAGRPASAVEMRESLRRAGLDVSLDESEATIVASHTTAVASNIADTVKEERETQLLHNARADSQAGRADVETSINEQGTDVARDVPTVTNEPPAPTSTRDEANNLTGATSNVAGAKSIVTQFSPTDERARGRRFSRRTLGLAAGVVLVALVGTSAYMLKSQTVTRNDNATPDNAAAAAPSSPTAQPAPPANAQPEAQTSAPANRETTPASGATVESTNTPHHAVNPTTADAPRQHVVAPEPTPAEKKIIIVHAPPPVGVPPPDFDPGADVAGDRPLTRQDLRAMKRRMREEDFKAFIMRQRELNDQRARGFGGGPRRRRGLPPPPP